MTLSWLVTVATLHTLTAYGLETEPWQEFEGPLSASLVARTIKNYNFAAVSLDGNSAFLTKSLLIQTGWAYIPGQSSIVYQLAF